MNIAAKDRATRSEQKKKLDRKKTAVGAKRKQIALYVEALQTVYPHTTGSNDKAILLDWFMAQIKALDPK